MRNRRFIQFYDHRGLPLMAMDGVLHFDQRMANETVLAQAFESVQNQARAYLSDPIKYVRPQQCYAQVIRGSWDGQHDKPVTSIRSLDNPVYKEVNQ